MHLAQASRLGMAHGAERVGLVGERAEPLAAAKGQPPLGTSLPFAGGGGV